MSESLEYWVRNQEGRVWGPLPLPGLQALVKRGVLGQGPQVSADGSTFVPPGRMAELREVFPKELWGEESAVAGGVIAGPGARAQAAARTVAAAASGAEARPRGRTFSIDGLGTPVEAAKPSAPAAGPAPVAPKAPESPKVVAPAAPAEEFLPDAGDLAQRSSVHLYYLLASSAAQGKLTLSGDGSLEIFFKKGSPESLRSSKPEDEVGHYLVSRGVLSASQLEDATKLKGNFGGELVGALFGLNLINPQQAFQALMDHALMLLGKALALEKGSYRFEPAAPAPTNAMPLGGKWDLLCRAVRGFSVVEVKRRLGERAECPIMRSSGKVQLADLKLTPQEARAAGYFDGVRSPNEIAATFPNEADTVYRLAFLLAEVEVVSFALKVARSSPAPAEPKVAPKEARPAEPPVQTATVVSSANAGAVKPAAPVAPSAAGAKDVKPAAGAKPSTVATGAKPVAAVAAKPAGATAAKPAAGGAPVKPAVVGKGPAAPAAPKPTAPAPKPPEPKASGPSLIPVEITEDVAKLKAVVEAIKGQDHFKILNLPQNATGSEAKAAYFRFAKIYHPDTSVGATKDIADLRGSLFSAINRAYEVLGDDGKRSAYLEELKLGADKLDIQAIFAAEQIFQKGTILLKGNKTAEALKAFEEAVKLNEKEGEFYAWRGYTRFLLAKDKKQGKAEAIKDVETAIRLNERCAPACYLAGQVEKLAGDNAAAEKWFKRCTAIDPKHVEAQRELRLASTRK